MKNITILGSTGSIGRNTIEVISRFPDRFKVLGLAAGRNVELLQKQINKFNPKFVCLERREDAEECKKRCGDDSIRFSYGQKGAEEVAGSEENDIVVSAITGINGLRPTVAAIKSGKRVALANKESMVIAGSLINKMAGRFGAEIIPVDSEHSGVFQCLAKERFEDIKRVILTASGGPFFLTSLEEMKQRTLEEVLNHPRWKMGKKVTVDSATLMNKGLELIEAKWFFNLVPQQLYILVHPQSIVHSLVEMKDGSVLAQLSITDMKIPIQYALTYPKRETSPLPSLTLNQMKKLEFYEVDRKKFPLVEIARTALEEGGSLPVALNAADEIAVDAFIRKRIKFSDISEIVTEIVEKHKKVRVGALEDIFDIDRDVNDETRNLIEQRY